MFKIHYIELTITIKEKKRGEGKDDEKHIIFIAVTDYCLPQLNYIIVTGLRSK